MHCTIVITPTILLCNASLVHCFLVLGAIYFWCCVFGAMQCQLYRAGLLPQWRIFFMYTFKNVLSKCLDNEKRNHNCFFQRQPTTTGGHQHCSCIGWISEVNSNFHIIKVLWALWNKNLWAFQLWNKNFRRQRDRINGGRCSQPVQDERAVQVFSGFCRNLNSVDFQGSLLCHRADWQLADGDDTSQHSQGVQS